MRMTHYYLILAGLAAPALIATAVAGMLGWEAHLAIGLFAAMLTVALHSAVILFMIITGRVLREAVMARDLGQGFLDELNLFFSKKRGYPIALFGAFTIVAAAVLGYGNLGFGISPAIHMLAGLGATLYTLLSIPLEASTLRDNQALLDRAASELDRLEQEQGLPISIEEIEAEEEFNPERLAKWALKLTFAAWLPYLYWCLIVWKGDFSQVSIHPFLEISLVAFALWFLAKRTTETPASTSE